MKNRFKTYIILTSILFYTCWGKTSLSQNANIDSLIIQYKKEKTDSNKINPLYDLAWEFQRAALYDSALKYANVGINLATQISKEQETARFYNCIGVVYKNCGFYSKAIANYLKALKIAEKFNDGSRTASILSNIGALCLIQNRYSEAEVNFSKALELSKKDGNKKRIAQLLLSFANLYHLQKKLTLSQEFYLKSLKMSEELGNKDGVVVCFENLGVLYHEQKDYPTALKYYSDALMIAENKKQRVDLYTNMAQINFSIKNDFESERYFLKSLALTDSIGALEPKVSIILGLSDIYKRKGNLKKSFDLYKEAIVIKDSLFKRNKSEEIVSQEMNYEFEKKEAIIKVENEKAKAIAEEKSRVQKLILILISCVLVLVFSFALFILRSLNITRKQKTIIETKNIETELQKKIIEEKNKDITDSINYAKQIQRALLRDEEHVSSHLPEHAILFMPKDIVSGDFYWATEKEEYWYFAVADCTGHGVPGAIMSILGISFLNDISFSEKLLSPNEILNKLRDRIVSELRQGDESIGNRDGMDISLCRLNLKTLELLWAGANNSLNLIRNGHLEIIKADKQPIGYYPNPKPFTNHTFQLQKGDSVFIYSDGYADQFGGEKGKKLTYKRLENSLVEKSALPLKEQKEFLKKAFIDWKGSLEQVDDVCIVGVRV